MSEPNLKRYRWLAVDKPSCTASSVVNDRHAADEVIRPVECQREHLERICQLEKALEQSLNSSNELRQKLKDQYLLEAQLAATEEIANLQQQVITELKHQLAQQQSRERERALERLKQLEQQTVCLQEQLLQQSQQAGQYEATVQYWKERYLDLQTTSQRKEVEQVVLSCTDQLAGILGTVQLQISLTAGTRVASELPSSPSKNQPNQVDLPAFLTRHRRKDMRVGGELPPAAKKQSQLLKNG